jgi:hypothetical protein
MQLNWTSRAASVSFVPEWRGRLLLHKAAEGSPRAKSPKCCREPAVENTNLIQVFRPTIGPTLNGLQGDATVQLKEWKTVAWAVTNGFKGLRAFRSRNSTRWRSEMRAPRREPAATPKRALVRGRHADRAQEIIARLAQAPAAEEPRPASRPPIRRAVAMASLFLHVMSASSSSPRAFPASFSLSKEMIHVAQLSALKLT